MIRLTIRKVGYILSVAKLHALWFFLMGLILGILHGLLMIIPELFVGEESGKNAATRGFSRVVMGVVIAMISSSVFFVIFGFISGIISALYKPRLSFLRGILSVIGIEVEKIR